MTRTDHFKELAFILLEETFESRDKGGNYYLDKQTGWFPTLDALSAAEASFALVPGGSTIAAHTFHTDFYIQANLRELRGEPQTRIDWDSSWRLKVVDDAAWDDLRRRLRTTYEETLGLLEGATQWGESQVDVATATITHSAYHLGAVRQFLTALRARAASRA